MLNVWLQAFRLRTLPLALASIGMGSFLAAANELFRWDVFLLCSLTTIFLQVLSNLANDYGDSIHGADSGEREGPSRAVQSGAISPKAMLRAVILFTLLSLLSGLSLLYFSLKDDWLYALIFLGLGILAIAAAITYTAGSRPYGYAGLGDFSVLIFFGWVGVGGTYFLHTISFDWSLMLPASSCGLLSVAVLNVNNIRDIQSDEKAGKRSLAVRLGARNARIYHWCLLSLALVLSVAYVLLSFEGSQQFIFLLVAPLLWKNGRAVSRFEKPKNLDPYLKQMALTTLVFVLTFGIGQLI